ncbi:MAG: transporter substrate-binding domain-containing protein [Gammaproteobacteria bacterium]|nr:transporter substrate-binding domain-containing protein [Gammaproteobacteria bacterium]
MSLRLLVLFLLCCAQVPPARAGEAIRLCGAEWPPFTETANGRISGGISHAILQAAFARMKQPVELVALPWKRCEQAALAGQFAGVIDNTVMPGFITAGKPTSFFIIGVLVHADDAEREFRWELMVGQPVGAVLGYSYLPVVRRFDGWRRVDVRGERELLLGLGKKYYRYALCDGLVCPTFARQMGARVRFLKPYLGAQPMYLVLTPEHAELAARYGKALDELFAEGLVEELYRRHLGRGYEDVAREAREAGDGR